MRVGLVLGAGGVMGGAWLTGAVEALARETGWDPGSAEHVVGTSAGAMIGALVASGVPPWFMVAHSAGEVFEGLHDVDGRPASSADRSAGAVFRLERALPWLGPGSPALALAALRNPLRLTPAAAAAAWLPRGFVSTAPLRETIRRVVPAGWSDHPNLWIVACEYASGRRVAFGRADAPPADLADAVAASCAIPGFYRPVAIDRRLYVDGGMRSPSNLDLLRGLGLDLVVGLNPMSTLDPPPVRSPADLLWARMRVAAGRRLGREARRLRAEGTRVLLIQPTRADFALMGGNLMRRRGRHAVIEHAIASVGEYLRRPEVRDVLHGLPPGAPHRIARPAGPPAEWPPEVLPRRAAAAAARADAGAGLKRSA